MRQTVIKNIRTRFESYSDLAIELTEELIVQNIPATKNKSLKEHIWCVVGARESYSTALKAGEWAGFNCSLSSMSKDDIISKLAQSAEYFDKVVVGITEWTDVHDDLLLNLLEHETMHEGQIIRHMYALEKPLSSSWKWA